MPDEHEESDGSTGAIVSNVLGSLLGASGNLAGGFLSQISNSAGDQVTPFRLPEANFSLQSSLFDQGGQFGFGNFDLLRQTGPLNRLIDQIQALPMSERNKRRALEALKNIKSGDLDFDQPRGLIADKADVARSIVKRAEVNKNNIKRLERGTLAKPLPEILVEGEFFETDAGPRTGLGALNSVLKRIGLTAGDLDAVFSRQEEFDVEFNKLNDEFGTFQGDVIRDRLSAAAGIANTAAGFATGESSALQDRFREQILRDQGRILDDSEETILLQSQFGGFNPGSALEGIQQQRSDLPLDAELRSIERSFAVSSGANALLNPGSAGAIGAGALAQSANQSALTTSANQAIAANSLNSNILAVNAISRGNAVGAATQNLTGIFAPTT